MHEWVPHPVASFGMGWANPMKYAYIFGVFMQMPEPA
jgi:hypothetical protein